MTGLKSLSFENILSNFLPTSFNNYWFLTTYIVFSLFIPSVNKLIANMSKKDFSIFVLILVFVFSTWSLITLNKFTSFTNGGLLAQFLMYYSVGAYIRKYPNSNLKKYRFVILFGSITILVLSVLICDFIGLSSHSGYFYVRGSVVVVLLSASLVQIAVCAKPIYNRLISSLGVATLGVYLIHDHPFVREWLWKDLFNNTDYVTSPKMLIHFTICTLSVFIICLIIDWLRNLVFGNIEKSILSKLQEIIINFFCFVKKIFQFSYEKNV